jgi:hypothetical protein
MANTVITVLAVGLLFIGLPVLILRIKDRRRNARSLRDHPPASRTAERQVYAQRILTPDWACVERHLGRPVPPALRDLYADRELITRRDLRYTNEQAFSTFEPLDEQAILDSRRWLGFEAVAIATTEFGDAFHLRPGAAEKDTVYLTHHDGGDTESFAESVTQMLAALREANTKHMS